MAKVRAGLYCRISKDIEDTRLGVRRQEADLRQLCADRDWEVAGVYVDNSLSASSGVERPQYRRLLADISAGRIEAVAVWDLDRLTRRPIELEEFVQACDRAGVSQLAFVGGSVDMGTGDGLLVARIKGAVAAEEARKTGQRIRRKHQELAERGLSHGGRRVFGFRDDNVTVDEGEAVLIREAASRVLAGESAYSVAHDWNGRGLASASGGRWTTKGLTSVLRAPRTAGLREHTAGRDKRTTVLHDASWPAILDRREWEQVRAVIASRTGTRPPVSHEYPLRGVLACGECGRPLTAVVVKGRRSYGCRKDNDTAYGCGRVKILAERVEPYVFGVLVPMADDEELREALRSDAEGDQEAARELVLENAQDLAVLERLGDDYADGVMDRATYQRQKNRLTARVESRQSRLATLRGTSALDHLGGGIAERWETMATDEKRLVLQAMVKSVIVDRQRVKGSNAFDPSRIRFQWASRALDVLLGDEPGLAVDEHVNVFTISVSAI